MKLTTTNLSLPQAARWLDRMQIPPALLVAIVVLATAAGISGVNRLLTDRPFSAASQVPTARPIVIIATAPALAIPTQAPQLASYAPAAAPVRYVVGFDRPNGTALGAIPMPDASAIVARSGDAWLETTHDGAPIWVRASELGMGLADVAPTNAPAIVERPVSIAAEPASGADAVATPAPPVPTLAPQQMVLLDRQQWAIDARAAQR